MSTSQIIESSPKKRKIANGTVAESKRKKRKHAVETQSEEVTEPASQTSTTEGKQRTSKSKSKDESKSESKSKSKKKSKEPKPSVPDVASDVSMEDIEEDQPDQPTSQTAIEEDGNGGVDSAPGRETDATNGLETNGIMKPDTIEDVDESMLQSTDPTCFYSKRLSLYVPIPAISLSTPTSSLMSLHLSPLLLTYFPPAGGIVLAFSDPVLSARAQKSVNLPLQPPKTGGKEASKATSDESSSEQETFAQCADQFGVCWLWLTATFLVFAPQPGDRFKAWANVQSESFIGLVSYNYFQTSIMKNRIPKSWKYDGPSTREASKQKKKTKKGKLRGVDTDGDADADEGGNMISTNNQHDTTNNNDEEEDNPTQDAIDITLSDGHFTTSNGQKIQDNQQITVHGVDMVPGSERGKFGLQIDGSLLSPEEEEQVLSDEKREYNLAQSRLASRLGSGSRFQSQSQSQSHTLTLNHNDRRAGSQNSGMDVADGDLALMSGAVVL